MTDEESKKYVYVDSNGKIHVRYEFAVVRFIREKVLKLINKYYKLSPEKRLLVKYVYNEVSIKKNSSYTDLDKQAILGDAEKLGFRDTWLELDSLDKSKIIKFVREVKLFDVAGILNMDAVDEDGNRFTYAAVEKRDDRIGERKINGQMELYLKKEFYNDATKYKPEVKALYKRYVKNHYDVD